MREYAGYSENAYREHGSRGRRAAQLRRIRQRRRQKLMRAGVIGSLLILFIVLSAFHLNASANSVDAVTPVYKYYTSHQIQYGDTLWSIAEQYHPDSKNAEIAETVKEIRSINHLSSFETIKAGEYVVVPYFSTEYK